MVIVENLNFAHKKGTPLFVDFNWSIQPNERWSIIGPSGCGKTTLLYLLSGLIQPSSGKINIDHNLSNGQRALIGLVLQDYGLLPWATAFENVTLGLKIKGVEKEERIRITQRWLAEVGLKAVSQHYPAELSGGQRQRVAIARTLALKPALLLMDEPFASLDAITREDLLDLTLTLWKKQPSTMVLVTHSIEEAVFWGNRVLVLKPFPNYSPEIVENPDSGTPGYRGSSDFALKCKLLRELIEVHSRNGKSGAKE